MNRIDRSYQKIFHPLAGAERESKGARVKKVLESIGLCAGTLCIMPLIVGSVKKYRDYKASHIQQNQLPVDSVSARIRDESERALPSAKQEVAESVINKIVLNPEGIKLHLIKRPSQITDSWNTRIKTEIFELSKEGILTPWHSAFKLLMWEIEGRNIGPLSFVHNYDLILESAISVGKPEAIARKIKDLYNLKDAGQNVDDEIDKLRAELMLDDSRQGLAAMASICDLEREEGDLEWLQAAAEKGVEKAICLLAGRTGNKIFDDHLSSYAEEDQAFYQIGCGILLGEITKYQKAHPVFHLKTSLGEDSDYAYNLILAAAQLGHKEAIQAIVEANTKGKDALDPSVCEWLEVIPLLFKEKA